MNASPSAAPHRQLPAVTRPGAVRLQVAALGRSLAFYEGVLGLGVLDRKGPAVVLGAGGAALVVLNERPGVRPVDSVTRLTRLGLRNRIRRTAVKRKRRRV